MKRSRLIKSRRNSLLVMARLMSVLPSWTVNLCQWICLVWPWVI